MLNFLKRFLTKKTQCEDFFKKHEDKISSSMKPYIEIKARKSNNLSLWQSKFLGSPYLPKGQNYPKNSKGDFLYLLAQINFEEMPILAPYPEKGILQFWITADDAYGADFDNPTKQDNFKVTYYPEIQKEDLVSDFSFLPNPDFFPFEDSTAECKLKFGKKEMPVGVFDYRFETVFGYIEKMFGDDYKDDFYDAYMDRFDSTGHHMGGYPYFTQTDPRVKSDNKDSLLLQIDTDVENNIMWGDCGVANFFISEEDLKKKDFTNILYHWDCC